MIFTRPKRSMNSYLTLFGILLVGFIVYFLIRDKLFDIPSSTPYSSDPESFNTPAPTSIEIRQAPLYPPRVIAPSGSHGPSQAPPQDEVIVHREPQPTDHYSDHHENSEIPENLRYPERSFRAPPLNDQTDIAVQSGVASNHTQVSSNNTQSFQQEFIQGGGEFMPGIFANDTFDDKSFSSF